ncbi:MAG: hypothetical protein Q9179_007001 [Wetmoreana sp. 5 TL-2023]
MYRVSGNSPHFQESLSATSISELDDLDVMGETLLFKAVKHSDSTLVRNNRYDVLKYILAHQSSTIRVSPIANLHIAASYADIKTLEILKTAIWVTDDADKMINNVGAYTSITPRTAIMHRRIQTESSKRLRETTSHPLDEDPEEVYQAFIKLIQKILDDHYDFSGSKPTKRMVPFPREGFWFWDIVEETTHLYHEGSETESDNETWEDAVEIVDGGRSDRLKSDRSRHDEEGYGSYFASECCSIAVFSRISRQRTG